MNPDKSRKEMARAGNLEQWFLDESELDQAAIEERIKALGGDPEALEARFEAAAAMALGRKRRAEAKALRESIDGLIGEIRSGLKGSKLAEALAKLRASLPEGVGMPAFAAYRSLDAEADGEEMDEEQIALDLMTLAELVDNGRQG